MVAYLAVVVDRTQQICGGVADLNLKEESAMSESKRFTIEEARRIGTALGVDWMQFDLEQFRLGLEVELEHGTRNPVTDVTHDDPLRTGKIVLTHLHQFPDYYTRLAAMKADTK